MRQRNCNVRQAVVHIVRRPEVGFLLWKLGLSELVLVSVVAVEELVQAQLGSLDPTCLQGLSILH